MSFFKNIRIKRWWLLAILLPGLFLLIPLTHFESPYSGVLLDRDGHLLGASIAADEQWRFPPLQNVPKKYEQAALLYEDKRFYQHPGIDPLALARAVRDNLLKGEIVSGASTITMQVVRLSRPGRSRTVFEKMIEMLLALRLEFAASKEKILAMYASHAPFGGNVVGLEAAAWRYFGRAPGELSWAESATLAVLPNSPALVHPGRNRELLLKKRNDLLETLVQKQVIDSLTFVLSSREPLLPAPQPLPMLAPHLLQRINAKNHAGDRFVSTLKKSLQERATAVAHRHVQQLARSGIHNTAVLLADVQTAEVLAYIGNCASNDHPDFSPHVDIIPAPRSSGSILKPLLYASMLESGELLPNMLVPDIPTQLGGFMPENYTRTYQGAVPAYEALARSLNVPAVRMLQRFGVDRFYDHLQRLGMTTLFRPAQDYGLSLILGGAEATLWDMVGMYAGLLRGAEIPNPMSSSFYPLRIETGEPETTATSPLLSPSSCWLTLQAMLDVTRPGEDKVWRQFESSQPIYWKTGTSYGFRDGWAIGLTSRYAVGVWVGNADGEGRPELTGISSAAPLLFDLFDILELGAPIPLPAGDFIEVKVCQHSGYRAGLNCEETAFHKVGAAGKYAETCPFCHRVFCDSTRQWRVSDVCERISDMQPVSWFVLPPAMEWFYRSSHPDYQPLPPFRSDCQQVVASNSTMTLIRLENASSAYVPIELDGSRGGMVFQATHRHPEATIFWHLDEKYVTATHGIHQVVVAPSPGRHVLTLVDVRGEVLEREFTILAK